MDASGCDSTPTFKKKKKKTNQTSFFKANALKTLSPARKLEKKYHSERFFLRWSVSVGERLEVGQHLADTWLGSVGAARGARGARKAHVRGLPKCGVTAAAPARHRQRAASTSETWNIIKKRATLQLSALNYEPGSSCRCHQQFTFQRESARRFQTSRPPQSVWRQTPRMRSTLTQHPPSEAAASGALDTPQPASVSSETQKAAASAGKTLKDVPGAEGRAGRAVETPRGGRSQHLWLPLHSPHPPA